MSLGTIAWECPVTEGVLHLNDDVQITELVDDAGRPVGEGGRACGGDAAELHGHALDPVPRRGPCRGRVADMRLRPAVQIDRQSQGRVTTPLRSKDGRVLNNVILSAVLGPYRQVTHYQVRQLGPEDLSIAVVPAKSWTPEVGDAIIGEFKARLGDSFRYQLRLCD
jgi:hypothetical protein